MGLLYWQLMKQTPPWVGPLFIAFLVFIMVFFLIILGTKISCLGLENDRGCSENRSCHFLNALIYRHVCEGSQFSLQAPLINLSSLPLLLVWGTLWQWRHQQITLSSNQSVSDVGREKEFILKSIWLSVSLWGGGAPKSLKTSWIWQRFLLTLAHLCNFQSLAHLGSI